MLPFGVTIPATVPQGSEIPEGLMNNPVYCEAKDVPMIDTKEQRPAKDKYLGILRGVARRGPAGGAATPGSGVHEVARCIL
jgi:hypothetical protein